MPRIVDPIPMHEAQEAICVCPARFRVVAAGRRFGKGVEAVNEEIAVGGAGGNVWHISPDYPTAQIHWRLLKSVCTQIRGVRIREADMSVSFGLSGYVQIKSALTTLRGEGLDLCVFDEAAHIAGLRATWEEQLRPALSDRRGRAMFYSTPFGLNDFFDLFELHKIDGDWKSFQFPTSANPFILPQEIEAARANLSERAFSQEYLAEFVTTGKGGIFDRDKIKVINDLPGPFKTVSRFFDLALSAKLTADNTASVKMGITPEGDIVVLDCTAYQVNWGDAVKRIVEIVHSDGPQVKFGIEEVFISGQAISELLRRPDMHNFSIVGVHPDGDKVTRAQAFAARVEHGNVSVLRRPWTEDYLQELSAFPIGRRDDRVDASSGAYKLLAQRRGPLEVNVTNRLGWDLPGFLTGRNT